MDETGGYTIRSAS